MHSRKSLTADGKRALTALVGSCNAFDKTKYSADDTADRYIYIMEGGCMLSAVLIYDLGETFQGSEACEIAAYTLPESRNKGLFSSVMKKASPFLKPVIKIPVYENDAAEAVLSAYGAGFSHDELLMAKQLPDTMITDDDCTGEIEPEEGRIRSPYGEAYYITEGSRAYIYGVLTYPSHRGKGFAKSLLKKLLLYLGSNGTEKAVLEVSSLNAPALGLYRSLGFSEEERLSIWYLGKDRYGRDIQKQ